MIKSHSINGIQVEVKKAMERDQRGGGGSGGRGGNVDLKITFKILFTINFCIDVVFPV